MLFRLAAASASRPDPNFEKIGAHKLTERESDGNPWPVWGIEINTLQELLELIKAWQFGPTDYPAIILELPVDEPFDYIWEDRTFKVPEIKFYDDNVE